MPVDTVAEQIRRRLGELSPAETKVARVLLANYPAAGFETLAVLATQAKVSAPTVLRLVTRLGYSGFPAFQAVLRDELGARDASPLTLHPAAGEPADPNGVLDHAGGQFGRAIQRTFAETSERDLDRTIALLSDPRKRISLAGGRFSGLFAQYLALHLMQLRDAVDLLPEHPVHRASAAASFGPKDVLVLFDYRRYEPPTERLAELAAERKATIVLFTDPWLSPVSHHAAVVLAQQVTAPSAYDSFVPTIASIEALVALLLNAHGETSHAKLAEREEIVSRLGLH
ncbi:MurR/RpiR family transcriptional regulator [Amycolatopsis sp. NPDC004625]|uniref:MurR/RpiR family transcriptional regulator n=1 Tax=Amycolatopsis sp. NPDC004625 TaxID=3154670 RepID=UPI0033BA0080